jgi:hypothetical protein
MRVTFAVLGMFGLVCACAHGDPAVIIRERAKELSNQNNVRQGVTPPTQVQPAQPAAAPVVAAGPTLSPGILRFNTELAGIHVDTIVTEDQKQKLAQDLILAAQTAKPSMALASKLATDVSAAFAEKPLPASSRARFIQELDAVLNPSKYPQAKIEGIITDIQAIFQENGLARMKALAIAQDVKAISDQIQKGGA